MSFELVIGHSPAAAEQQDPASQSVKNRALDDVHATVPRDQPAIKPWEPAGPARLLIADDVPTVRESLAKLLRAEGYEVDVATDGRDALGRFEQARVDLVLLDLDMPSTHGWDVLEQLLAIKPDQAIIIVTGKAEPCNWAAVRRPGILIEKPIDVPLLLKSIREALHESSKTRAERVAVQRALTRHTRPLTNNRVWEHCPRH